MWKLLKEISEIPIDIYLLQFQVPIIITNRHRCGQACPSAYTQLAAEY